MWHHCGDFYSLSLVVVSKVVGSQIPGQYCVQCHSFPYNNSFSTFIPSVPLPWLDLIFCHSLQSPQSWQQIYFVASIYLCIRFYIISQKYMLNKIRKQPRGHIFIFIFLSCICFSILNNQEIGSCDHPKTRSCDCPRLHILGWYFLLLFFCRDAGRATGPKAPEGVMVL